MEFNYLENDLLSIEIIKDEVNSILISTKDDISIKKIVKERQTIKSFNFGEIKDSFYKSAKNVGIPDSIIMDFAYIFGWDIDFVFDIRSGDSFEILYEEYFYKGEKIKNGDIKAARFKRGKKVFSAIRFFSKASQTKEYLSLIHI